jgi:hypothetical protein
MRYDVYLSGPITPVNGRTFDENVQAGIAAAERWRALGYTVFCPHEFAYLETIGYDIPTLLEFDLRMLALCDRIVLTGSWRISSGCLIELEYARVNGIKFLMEV